MDDFSRSAFSPEFHYVAITPENWQRELTDKPDLLMVESAFGGNQGAWVNQIAGFCPPRPALSALTDWCRHHGIPTVFWNKEDPANYEWFIGAASAFDWVFTVDALSIDRYRRDLGHTRVAPLSFAAQPAIHFPPESDDLRTGDVAFAGSYYARKHTERRRQMEMILEPSLDFGLDIFDRMGNLDDPRFAWPEQYRPHLRGSLTYPQTTEAYRRYKVFLNVNTVTDSPTMCARRVFELLASGTSVITGPADAIDAMVPDEAIRVARSKDETKEHLETLLSSGEARSRITGAGLRWINNGNSVEARVNEILETIGIA
jgi:spore maturation protein CgeB